MSTALVEREKAEPVVTKDQLDLIKSTVAVDATDAELKLFLYDCARQGVHPLDRLLIFTKRGDPKKYTPITSIDFMRIRAADSGEMAGSDDPVFTYLNEGAVLQAATVTVYRLTQGQRFAYTATARWSEYKPSQDFMWRKMPHTMLGKCAEALALRKGFPKQLAGLYAKEEMEQAGNQDTPRETEPRMRQGGTVPKPAEDTVATVLSPGNEITMAPRVLTDIDLKGLPKEAVYLTRVEPAFAPMRARLTAHTGDSYPCSAQPVEATARQACKDMAPVFLDMEPLPEGGEKVKRIRRTTALPF